MGTDQLRRLAPTLWETSCPLHSFGMELGHRMAVCQLPSGASWVYSPVPLDAALRVDLAAVGPVRHIVIPSRTHDLWLKSWFDAYPDARGWAAPGVATDHPELPIRATLRQPAPAEWEGAFDLAHLAGIPRLNEIVIRHAPTRTLLVADLVFNLHGGPSLSRLLLRIDGAYGRLTPSRLFRAVIRDADAFRASLEQVLKWDFDRIVVSHGAIVETGGREALKSAFDWLEC